MVTKMNDKTETLIVSDENHRRQGLGRLIIQRSVAAINVIKSVKRMLI
jgi:hypothetical protein